MTTTRCVSTLVVCLATLVSACSAASNDEVAHVTKRGSAYLVEMKGRRRLMTHDPISAVRGRTYEDTLTIELPRIEGAIEGSEIPVRQGYLRYVGRVIITNAKMKVDLYYDDRDEHTQVPLLWNGRLHVGAKRRCRASIVTSRPGHSLHITTANRQEARCLHGP